jgi:septal ring factor EnvC (AmiA/AmiB activator)
VIASVGDSGSLEGSLLHFAVFVNQQTENPESWLK